MIVLLTGLAAAEPTLQPGQYGIELWVTSATQTPILGEIKGQSVSWLLATVEEQDSELWQTHTTCAVELLDTFGQARASFSSSFVDALADKHYPLQTVDGYIADVGTDYIGYNPAWPLPTSASDPGVLDWDGDGHPGATISLSIPLVGTAEMYIVQRARMSLVGTIASPTRVSGGLLLPLFEQQTLGATARLLDRSPPVRPLPEQSGFSMAALPEGTDCSSVAAALCEAGVARAESCDRLLGD